jgi:hypothetical protein
VTLHSIQGGQQTMIKLLFPLVKISGSFNQLSDCVHLTIPQRWKPDLRDRNESIIKDELTG